MCRWWANEEGIIMGSARYIGRVGALAIALGVGMAVATTPGVAWADDTDGQTQQAEKDPSGDAGTSSTSTPPSERPRPGEAVRDSVRSAVDNVRRTIGVVTSSGGAHSSTHGTGPSSQQSNAPKTKRTATTTPCQQDQRQRRHSRCSHPASKNAKPSLPAGSHR